MIKSNIVSLIVIAIIIFLAISSESYQIKKVDNPVTKEMKKNIETHKKIIQDMKAKLKKINVNEHFESQKSSVIQKNTMHTADDNFLSHKSEVTTPSPATNVEIMNEITGFARSPMFAPVDSIYQNSDLFLINQINNASNNSLSFVDIPKMKETFKEKYIRENISFDRNPQYNDNVADNGSDDF